MKRLLMTLLLAGCGRAEPELTARLYLPSAIVAADLQSLELRALDQDKLPLPPAELCQRYIERVSLPADLSTYPQGFATPGGVTAGEHHTLTDLPIGPNGSTYLLLVEASDLPLGPSGRLQSGGTTARACTPNIALKSGQTKAVTACLYFFTSMGELVGPPNSEQCPAQ